MKILFATMQFGRGYSQGTERYLSILSGGLRQRGHDAIILAGDPEGRGPQAKLGEPVEAHARGSGPRPRAADPAGVSAVLASPGEANAPTILAYPTHGWTAVQGTPPDELVDLLRQLDPDVVHIANPTHIGLGLVEAAGRLGIPVVVTIMDYWWVCPKQTLLHFRGGICDGNVPWRECIACVAAERGRSWRRRIAHLPLLRDAVLPAAYLRAWRKRGVRDDEIERWKNRREWIANALGRAAAVIFPSRTAREIVGPSLAGSGATDVGLTGGAPTNGRSVAGNSTRRFDIPYGLEPLWFDESRQRTPPSRAREQATTSPERERGVAPRSDDTGVPRRDLAIGYAGALAPHKGVHLILEALHQLDWRDTRLTIAGGGDADYVARLEKRATGLDVTFAGRIPAAEMPAFIRRQDLMIVPSLWPENLPLAVLESYACGVPVLASRVGGIAELVPERDTFEVGSANSLAACLRDWTTRPDAASPLPPVSTAEEMVASTEAVYLFVRKAGTAHG